MELCSESGKSEQDQSISMDRLNSTIRRYDAMCIITEINKHNYLRTGFWNRCIPILS